VFVPTQADLDNAVLPVPPEQDSGVTKLIRPGLLADVEIQVESIPNALHVPSQAIYRQNGKAIVYVQGKDGKFTAREVALVKQSESFMVLASGVEAGDVVALSDPTLSKAADKMSKTEEKKGSGTGMPMPGAN
jgi:multidrug efflux system membrane fusion protein